MGDGDLQKLHKVGGVLEVSLPLPGVPTLEDAEGIEGSARQRALHAIAIASL